MMADSVITVTSPSSQDAAYETETKYYVYPGVGCITTWGDYTYNNIESYLADIDITPEEHSVVDLAKHAKDYIDKAHLRDENIELGFHIGGFDRNKEPRLYHVYWGFERPRPKDQQSPSTRMNEHSDDILYNGRNDLAYKIISPIIKQAQNKEYTGFNLTSPRGRILLCDYVARFSAKISPQVGPPFIYHLVFPDNTIKRIENKSYNPIHIKSIKHSLPKIFTSGKQKFIPETAEVSEPHRIPTGTSITGLLDNTPSNNAGTATPLFPNDKDNKK